MDQNALIRIRIKIKIRSPSNLELNFIHVPAKQNIWFVWSLGPYGCNFLTYKFILLTNAFSSSRHKKICFNAQLLMTIELVRFYYSIQKDFLMWGVEHMITVWAGRQRQVRPVTASLQPDTLPGLGSCWPETREA